MRSTERKTGVNQLNNVERLCGASCFNLFTIITIINIKSNHWRLFLNSYLNYIPEQPFLRPIYSVADGFKLNLRSTSRSCL